MDDGLEARLKQVETRIDRLEERYAHSLTMMQELNEKAAKAVERMAVVAQAAEDMRNATRSLLAEKESRSGRHQRH